jgi:cyclophilin family peptidyl-prolyl cis-trans isomerase
MKKLALLFVMSILTILVANSQDAFPDVVIETTEGNITIRLYDNTPLHSENFVKLVNAGYYENLLFHRVIKNFMIQTGDPKSKNAPSSARLGDGGPNYTIPPEFNAMYFHKKGALAAARLGDNINPRKESSGSQFYIVVGQVYSKNQLDQFVASHRHSQFSEEQIKAYTTIGGTPHLDTQYTVFGEVIEGLDIIDKISAAETDSNDRPLKDIRIIKAYTKKK